MWDGNGFWPRDDLVRLQAPEPRACEDPDRMHQRGDVAKWEGGMLQTL